MPMINTARRAICSVLAIAVLVAGAGCGGGEDEQARPVPKNACAGKVGAPGEPTTRLTYQGRAGLGAVVPVLCERLADLNVSHRVQLEGRDRVVIEVPRDLPPAVRLADVRAVARTGQLAIYDWESLVIGPRGKPDPLNRAVTGGPGAGMSGALTLYDAILRAKDRPAKKDADNSRDRSIYYAVDPENETVYGAGEDRTIAAESRAEALAGVKPAGKRSDVVVHEIKPGTVILRAERPPDWKIALDRWFVLEDDIAMKGDAIRNPRQAVDQAGGSGEPVVTFEFTDAGAKTWQRVTLRIAERGRSAARRSPGSTAEAANQHFAIAIDNELVSIPFIDFRLNPAGIDGHPGSLIQGGFTITSARRLAAILRSGPLPVALRPVP